MYFAHASLLRSLEQGRHPFKHFPKASTAAAASPAQFQKKWACGFSSETALHGPISARLGRKLAAAFSQLQPRLNFRQKPIWRLELNIIQGDLVLAFGWT
jgi:hypothetical protein